MHWYIKDLYLSLCCGGIIDSIRIYPSDIANMHYLDIDFKSGANVYISYWKSSNIKITGKIEAHPKY